jgi:soluble lytic murein transglycosylase-like protein
MRALLILVLWSASAAWGAEIAVLHTGARLRADRIERDGAKLILHDASGRIELDAALVQAIEVEPEPPAPAPLPAPEAAPAPAAKGPRELVTEAARRYGLPPEFVHSVAAAESAYNPKALSHKGAIGVMQLMPGTARQLNANPHVVEENIDAGARLLRDLLLRFQNDPNPVRRALAAYNAGEGAVKRYGGVPPYRETQAYVEKVIERYWKQQTPAARERQR